MVSRRKLAVGAASIAAMGAVAVPLGLSQGGGTIDVFVGSTPTPPVAQTYNLAVLDGTNGSTCDTTPTRLTTAVIAASVPLSATACSFNQAWLESASDDDILVKNDTYPDQTFTQRGSAMTSPGVTFWAGDSVTIGTLKFGDNTNGFGASNQFVDWITVRALTTTSRMTVTGQVEFGHADDVTACDFNLNRGYSAASTAVYWQGDTNRTTLCRADICCVDNKPLMESFLGDSETVANNSITIEDANLHSIRRSGGSGVHNECHLVNGAPSLTYRRTHWWGCTSGVNFNMGAFGNFGTTVNNYNWTIENSIFEAPTDLTETDKLLGFPVFTGCNTPVAANKTGWVVQNNIFEGSWYDGSGTCGDSGMIFRNNILRTGSSSCPGGTVTYNVFDRTCAGTGNVNGGATATVFGSGNFPSYNSSLVNNTWTYSASATFINAGDPSNCPAVDITGAARPLSGTCDVGPYEAG